MSTAATDSPACRTTSAVVRYGIAALLVVFYGEGLLRGGPWYSWLIFGALLVPAVIGLMITTRELPRGLRPRLIDIALAVSATLAVSLAVREGGLTPVLAASLMGVIAAIISMLHNRVAAAAVPLYCGAFAGMTSALVLAGWPAVAVAGVIAGLLVSVLRATWDGVGGKLGLLAFGGVYVTALAARALGTIGSGAPVLELDRADRLAIVVVPMVAATVTWLLRHRGLSPVLASAAPTAIFTLAVQLINHREPFGYQMVFSVTPLCVAWFGGSFIGMTAPGRVGGRLWPLLIAAMLFGVLQIGFKPKIAGFGGDFGASAVVAVLAAIGLVELVRIIRSRGDAPPAV